MYLCIEICELILNNNYTYFQAELLQVIHDPYIGGMIQEIVGYKESHIHDDPDVSQ